MNMASLVAALNGDIENALIAATPDGIKVQEKRGQTMLVNSTYLPLDSPWEQLAQLGIIRGEEIDDLFVNTTLPPGWSKRATEHDMWSELLDENGKKVADIFYKAAFYDRRAKMYLDGDADI